MATGDIVLPWFPRGSDRLEVSPFNSVIIKSCFPVNYYFDIKLKI